MSAEQTELELRNIPVEAIQPNPHQPRQNFDEKAIEELALSIRQKGVLQPITVRDISENGTEAYELVAGERRCRACELIERKTIPAIIAKVSDDEAVEVAFIENLQRENLTPIEEAHGLAGLLERYDGNKSKVAAAIGKSPGYVTDRLSLLELPEEVQGMLGSSEINTSQAKALLEIEDAGEQTKYAKQASRRSLDANKLKGITQHLKKGKGRSSRGEKGRKVSYKTLTRGLVVLYDDIQAMDPEKMSPEESATLVNQARVLNSGLKEMCGKLGNSLEEEPEEEEALATV